MTGKTNILHQMILWILRLVVGVIFTQEAFLKLSGNDLMVAAFDHIGMGQGGYLLIGMLELLVVILILIPYSSVYGAFLGLGVVTGAIIGHLTGIGIEGIHLAIIVFVCCLLLIYYQRKECSLFRNMMD